MVSFYISSLVVLAKKNIFVFFSFVNIVSDSELSPKMYQDNIETDDNPV